MVDIFFFPLYSETFFLVICDIQSLSMRNGAFLPSSELTSFFLVHVKEKEVCFANTIV